MAVVRTTMTKLRNHGIRRPDVEMIGEEDHEMLSVEIRSMTKRSTAEEGIGEIVPTMVLIGEEVTETLMILECTTGEEAIEVGRDEATITTRMQEDSIETQGSQSAEVTNLLPTILTIDEIRLTVEAQNTHLHNTKSNKHHQQAAATTSNHRM